MLQGCYKPMRTSFYKRLIKVQPGGGLQPRGDLAVGRSRSSAFRFVSGPHNRSLDRILVLRVQLGESSCVRFLWVVSGQVELLEKLLYISHAFSHRYTKSYI
jgi:hypothetical protein